MFTCVFSGMHTRYSNHYWGKKKYNLIDIIQIHRFFIYPLTLHLITSMTSFCQIVCLFATWHVYNKHVKQTTFPVNMLNLYSFLNYLIVATKCWFSKVLLQISFKIVFISNRPTFANNYSSHTRIFEVVL